MSDIIIRCDKLKDVNGNTLQYNIVYEVENGDVRHTFVVFIRTEEMSDAEDSAEAKTKANLVASVNKTKWLATTSSEEITELAGPVTL